MTANEGSEKLHTYKFRVLIIDDDVSLMGRMEGVLKGVTVTIDKRMTQPEIELLPIVVRTTDGKPEFTEETLDAVLNLRRRRFDLIMIDFAFADPARQGGNWGEKAGPVVESNEHMLSFKDLRTAVGKRAAATKRGNEASIDAFFHRRGADVLLRSFQHDRAVDILGAFEDRKKIAEGIFKRGVRSLNSFESIYGADDVLRREMYQKAPNQKGREVYRNVVLTISQLHLELAMTRYIARRAGKFFVLRRSSTLAALTATAAAFATIIQPAGLKVIENLQASNYLGAAIYLGGGLGLVAVASFLGARFFSRIVNSMLDSEEDRGE